MMRISMTLELRDVPGQLVGALEPISKHRGNIISILHLRDKKTRKEYVPVQVIFEVDSRSQLDKIKKGLVDRKIRIVKVGEEKGEAKTSVILIGHVVDTDVRDTIDRVNEVEGVTVADLDLEMPDPLQESSAHMTIVGQSEECLRNALEALEKVAKEKNLLIIKSLGS